MESQKVLIVDDYEPIRQGLGTYLSARGHEVACAACVEEARHRLAQGFSPDVVITDWHLSGREDGVDLVRQVQRFKPGVRAFVITAHPLNRLRRALGALRVNGVVHKPFSLQDISRTCQV